MSVLEPLLRALLVWCLFVGALVTLGVVAWVVREAWRESLGTAWRQVTDYARAALR